MTGKGSGRRPEQNVGDEATGYERIFDSIEEAEDAAEAENKVEDFGPWN